MSPSASGETLEIPRLTRESRTILRGAKATSTRSPVDPVTSGSATPRPRPPRISAAEHTKNGLNAFKKLGDLSAHNRRFNADADDIKRVRDDLRVAAEELLHLANLKEA